MNGPFEVSYEALQSLSHGYDIPFEEDPETGRLTLTTPLGARYTTTVGEEVSDR